MIEGTLVTRRSERERCTTLTPSFDAIGSPVNKSAWRRYERARQLLAPTSRCEFQQLQYVEADLMWDDRLRRGYDESGGYAISKEEAEQKGADNLSRMNVEQKKAFYEIIEAFDTDKQLFFLQVRFTTTEIRKIILSRDQGARARLFSTRRSTTTSSRRTFQSVLIDRIVATCNLFTGPQCCPHGHRCNAAHLR